MHRAAPTGVSSDEQDVLARLRDARSPTTIAFIKDDLLNTYDTAKSRIKILREIGDTVLRGHTYGEYDDTLDHSSELLGKARSEDLDILRKGVLPSVVDERLFELLVSLVWVRKGLEIIESCTESLVTS